VTYLESGHEGVRLVVTIDNIADDGARKLGETANEGDNVRTSDEVVEGNSGNDTFIGNELPNTLRGQLGKDNVTAAAGRTSWRAARATINWPATASSGSRSPTARSTR
jgi:Ca2+-binding RTX toxin-like protein